MGCIQFPESSYPTLPPEEHQPSSCVLRTKVVVERHSTYVSAPGSWHWAQSDISKLGMLPHTPKRHAAILMNKARHMCADSQTKCNKVIINEQSFPDNVLNSMNSVYTCCVSEFCFHTLPFSLFRGLRKPRVLLYLGTINLTPMSQS